MTNATEIAAHIISGMNKEDRAGFTPQSWFSGVSAMLVDEWEGADTEDVLEQIDALLNFRLYCSQVLSLIASELAEARRIAAEY